MWKLPPSFDFPGPVSQLLFRPISWAMPPCPRLRRPPTRPTKGRGNVVVKLLESSFAGVLIVCSRVCTSVESEGLFTKLLSSYCGQLSQTRLFCFSCSQTHMQCLRFPNTHTHTLGRAYDDAMRTGCHCPLPDQLSAPTWPLGWRFQSSRCLCHVVYLWLDHMIVQHNIPWTFGPPRL